MLTKPEKSTLLTDFILDYSENRLTSVELSAFQELMQNSKVIRKEASSSKYIRRALGSLPKRKCSERFDQKMAAKFALELERETVEMNAKRATDNTLSAT